MKDHENIHQKVQDLCACFSTTDPLQEMAALSKDADNPEAALKWIALAALHGINANAEKITLREKEDGKIAVEAEYRATELPSPGGTVGGSVFDAIRQITHIEENKGKTRLALGILDSSVDLTVSVKEKKGKRKISVKFP